MERNGPEHPRYKAVYSADLRDRIKALAVRALEHGVVADFLWALKTIDTKLKNEPMTFGDPYYRLPAAKLLVLGRIIKPLQVIFAVHQVLPVVFVRSLQPFPDDAF